MILVNQPQKKAEESGGSDLFLELKGICVGLGMSKPPPNITMFQFFTGIEKKVWPPISTLAAGLYKVIFVLVKGIIFHVCSCVDS